MIGDLQRAFGRGVRQERLRRGLSQKQWAEVLRIHRTFAGAVERGERNLTLGSVERLAQAMGIDALVLLGGGLVEAEVPPVLRAAEDGEEVVVVDYRESVEGGGGGSVVSASGSGPRAEPVVAVRPDAAESEVAS